MLVLFPAAAKTLAASMTAGRTAAFSVAGKKAHGDCRDGNHGNKQNGFKHGSTFFRFSRGGQRGNLRDLEAFT
ncbi:hypothetical protein GCWU000246_00981 [Jonquetella anthropi E3_33 E1]|nr:hypothetical protein GCWU000246_00981 [Jonquetella anthropi E3_33 E1]